MPSSLVVTALIVAWLAVLVPVVARRRQLVPRPAEADLCSRVLRRSGGPASMEVAVSGTTSPVRPSRSPAGATALFDRSGPADDHVDAPIVEDHDDGHLDDHLDDHDDRDGHEAGYDAGDGEDDDLDGREDADRTHAEHLDAHGDRRPRREFRPGRGGFDADAALAAADARYAFRRRVAVGLLVVAVLSALAALVITSAMWWLHLAVDLALVGYLVFLRRQTRLEEEVRERRLARARGDRRALETRRAERAEHERRLAEVDDWGAWEGDDTGDVTGDERADVDDPADDGLSDDELLEIDEVDPHDDGVVVSADAGRRSRRAAEQRRQGRQGGLPEGLELVEDTADDPAFHDLDADRVPAYRRAAGA